MKKLVLPLFFVFLIVGCKEENRVTHAESHAVSIVFDVSNESNIGSYNIYRNDEVIGQLAASGSSSDGRIYHFNDQEGITDHPHKLKYTIEPVFFDSTNANAKVMLKVKVDDEDRCSQSSIDLYYGDVAEIDCVIE